MMHKKPFSKQRYIAASYSCTTKPLSAVLTKCSKLIEKQQRFICKGYFRNHGINPMWILNNSTSIHKLSAAVNRKRNARTSVLMILQLFTHLSRTRNWKVNCHGWSKQLSNLPGNLSLVCTKTALAGVIHQEKKLSIWTAIRWSVC